MRIITAVLKIGGSTLEKNIEAVRAETVVGAAAPEICARPLAVSGRIEGYDVARAVAVLGMILVNYDVIFAGMNDYPDWYYEVTDFLFGRAAALFIMLAGAGISLMGRRGYVSGDGNANRKVRIVLLKRGAVLLIMGLLLLKWWSADILHFYSLFLLTGALMINASGRRLWMASAASFLISVVFFCFADSPPGMQELTGWMNMTTDIIDDLVFNGYYAFFPWAVFLLIGMWIGRQDVLSDSRIKRTILIVSLAVFVCIELSVRYLPVLFFQKMGIPEEGFIEKVLVSNVFPITPAFAVSAASGSAAVIIIALSISRWQLFSKYAGPLAATGKLSLTIYAGHIIIGYCIQYLGASRSGDAVFLMMTTLFPFVFCLAALFLSPVWFKYYSRGPLEGLLRRLSS